LIIGNAAGHLLRANSLVTLSTWNYTPETKNARNRCFAEKQSSVGSGMDLPFATTHETVCVSVHHS
jgi:hypothetical protein